MRGFIQGSIIYTDSPFSVLIIGRMRVEGTSLLKDSYHHSSKCFSSTVLQFQPISLFNRRYGSLDIYAILHIFMFIVLNLLISLFRS
jgi:hypothetical protein